MTQALAKYHARSPRYILQPQENFLIRVAGPMQVPWEEGTEIKNISLTGLSFTAPLDLCPLIGEIIKLEYEVPGSQKMASFAMVTRLEDMAGSKMLVGVKFYKLDLPQRIILAQGLALKLREQQIRQMKDRSKKMGKLAPYLPPILLAVWGFLFYIMMAWNWLQWSLWWK